MKIYKFVGVGTGVPGIPHEIKVSEGKQWISEFEEALKIEKEDTENVDGPFQAQQMKGAILKGALANKNYKVASVKDKKSSEEISTEEKETE